MWAGEAPAAVFAALGDPTRLALVARLCDEGPLPVARLTEGAGVSRQAVSKHLGVLEGAGLIVGTRRGRAHVWALAPERWAEARRWMDLAEARWERALGRLRSIVEDDR